VVVDVLWLVMAPENYSRLVHRRGGRKKKYPPGSTASITLLLFPEQP